jgi:hypothetical protein
MEETLGHVKDVNDSDKSSGLNWGPQGIEFACFHLAGDLNVRILAPVQGIKDIQVEITSGCDWGGGQDTRRVTVMRLSKSRARAVASAIMGAAAEL